MKPRTLSFDAIGTRWNIDVADTINDEAWDTIAAAVRSRIDDFDATYSRFRGDSLVTRIATTAGEYTLPKDGGVLLDFYHQLYEATGGLVTPLIGNTLSDAGYDAEYSLQNHKGLSRPPAWSEVIHHTNETIHAIRPVLLDFGAAGKGYLLDIIGQLLLSAGITQYVINAGGDILHHTPNDMRITIGLENPRDASEVIGTVELADGSLCASSGSRRSWGKYHHIINPATLESPTDIIATWVIAGDALHADGIATALFFVSPSALTQFAFDYAILRQDMSLEYSTSMPLTLFGE